MTESEWWSCTNSLEMLAFIETKVSERRLRLFGAACCRRLWSQLTDKRSRRLVEVAEFYAEGESNIRRLRYAGQRAEEAWEAVHWENRAAVEQKAASYVLYLGEDMNLREVTEGMAEAAGEVTRAEAWDSIWQTPGKDHPTREAEDTNAWRAGDTAEKAAQAQLLREIVGNPFRHSRVDPAWLSWNAGLVLQLAKTMVEQQTYEQFPILGDALEEAGCQDHSFLEHCRQPTEHVRGCWLLDLLLSRDR
jgi:hypothetical protein